MTLLNGLNSINLISTHHSLRLFLTEAFIKGNTLGTASRRCEGARKFVHGRGNEWLYKLAVPYQLYKRGSRINLIWRVARFVFEGSRPTEVASLGVAGGDGGSTASRDFCYQGYPCAKNNVVRRDNITPRIHCWIPFRTLSNTTKAFNPLYKALKNVKLCATF